MTNHDNERGGSQADTDPSSDRNSERAGLQREQPVAAAGAPEAHRPQNQ